MRRWLAPAPRRAGMALLATVALAGCGDLPRPFAGNPGATARRLAEPPPARLVVPQPQASRLPDAAAGLFARDMAASLTAREVPSLAQAVQPGDWSVQLSAETSGPAWYPIARLRNGKGEPQGEVRAPAVPPDAWTRGDAGAIAASAEALAAPLEDLLRSAIARASQNDPNSLINRPAQIFLRPVRGAPGDGDSVLYAAMRQHLLATGDTLASSEAEADFIIAPEVVRRRVSPSIDQIEIHWRVTSHKGQIAGDVAQGHDFPAGSLDGYWGEVAEAVASEAAPGVHTVIGNFTGRTALPPRNPPGAAAPAGK